MHLEYCNQCSSYSAVVHALSIFEKLHRHETKVQTYSLVGHGMLA